jgi:membrane fusion protein (multidrug efflux system)
MTIPATARAPGVFAFIALAAAALAGCGQAGEAGGEMPPPEVAVVEVTRGNVPTPLEYTGRAAGSRDVEIRARVSGILLERRYEEGSAVRQGDLLFRIDPEQYRAAAAQARAEVGVAQARLEEARRQRDRILPLFEQNAASQRQRDEVVSQFEVAQANLEAARARLRTAELDLGYTEVRAPIGGLTSREVRSEGSLVTAGTESSLLTRVVQTDPIYVEFSVPEGEAARVRAATAQGKDELDVQLLAEDGARPASGGKLAFVDTSVESGSGTVHARAVFPNPQGTIVPGQFVRVRVDGVAVENATTVPRRAVMSSAQGNFVWVVGKDDAVELRPVRLAGESGGLAMLADGVRAGERVIVEGVLKVRPGVKVKPVAPGAAPAGKQPQATSPEQGAGQDSTR